MFTNSFGWILPDADTSASRFRFWMASTLTVTPVVRLNRMFANAMAPRISTIPTPMKIFFLRLNLSSHATHECGDGQHDDGIDAEQRDGNRLRAPPVQHSDSDGQNDQPPDDE